MEKVRTSGSMALRTVENLKITLLTATVYTDGRMVDSTMERG